MSSFSIFLTNQLDFTKTIISLALMAAELIAHSAFRNHCLQGTYNWDGKGGGGGGDELMQ